MQTLMKSAWLLVLGVALASVLTAAYQAPSGKAQTRPGKSPAPPPLDVPEQPAFVERGETPAALNDLAARLKQLLKKDSPDAEVEVRDNELTIRYRTREFLVYGRNKTGEFSERPHDEEGPKFRGFLLHAWFHPERPQTALVVPQEMSEPYWTTFVNQYAIGSGAATGFVSVRLSYNHGTDSKVLERLKTALAADEKQPADDPLGPAQEQKADPAGASARKR
jgi:hypothetical protein